MEEKLTVVKIDVVADEKKQMCFSLDWAVGALTNEESDIIKECMDKIIAVYTPVITRLCNEAIEGMLEEKDNEIPDADKFFKYLYGKNFKKE